jgi:hypothetical protein
VRRACAGLLLVVLVCASCSKSNEDAVELERSVARSELAPRTFSYQALGENDAYGIRGEVADDLRYKMVLSHEGRALVQYIVYDDALAVRLPDPAFGKKLANELGHPTVDRALREGKWVVDPSGAPALFRRLAGQRGISSGDPFRDSREAMRVIGDYTADARGVKEFSPEDIEYRPQYDPWRYPDAQRDEVRFDLLRQPLPKSEAQTLGGQAGDAAQIGQFRKTSVFVKDDRVHEICSVVDIDGHEDIVRLREKGLRSNPFLAGLLALIKRKETAVPIEARTTIVTLAYADRVSIELPKDAVRGKLETFLSAFQQGVTAGALKPSRGTSIGDCRRAPDARPTD